MSRPDSVAGAALDALRSGSAKGDLRADTAFAPGIALRADPALGLGGRYRSPAGRLLELEAVPARPGGGWIALHIALPAALSGHDWLGLFCRTAAPAEVLVRPCLRSGTADGFADCFLPRHLLSGPDPQTHADALHLPTAPELPETAPWRELVLFLPPAGAVWHLHDLRLILA